MDTHGPRIAQFQLNMDGLLKLLCDSLYSTPKVAFRELVQNAHDACVRRELESKDAGYCPEIDVALETQGQRTFLKIRDNGIGLDADEIERFLATIGQGATGELRQALADEPLAALRLIGSFGVGFLAAYGVADRVELETLRLGAACGYRWVWEGRSTYRIETIQRSGVGTVVSLRIREDLPEYCRFEHVRTALTSYARFLEVPIRLGGTLLNSAVPPWYPRLRPGQRHLALPDIAAEFCEGRPPLACIPLRPFVHEALGPIDLQGVAFIPDRSFVSIEEHGNAAVFIRRMLVHPSAPDLLPPWARFVRAVLDCPQLSPTASREQIRHDATLEAVQGAIARQLLEEMQTLATSQPKVWEAIVRAHETLLKSWAALTPVLLERAGELVRVNTSRGPMTLPELADAGGGVVRCYTSGGQAGTAALLAESLGFPVADARATGDRLFLGAWCDRKGIPLVVHDQHLGAFLDPVREVSAELEGLVRRLRSLGPEVRVVSFSPVEFPGLRTGTGNPPTSRTGDATSPVPASIEGVLPLAPPAHSEVLYLNARSPLVQAAAQLDPTSKEADSAAQVIDHLAGLLSGEAMRPERLRTVVSEMAQALLVLLGKDAGPSGGCALTPAWLKGHGVSLEHARQLCQAAPTLRSLAERDSHGLAKACGLAVPIIEALQHLARSEDREDAPQ